MNSIEEKEEKVIGSYLFIEGLLSINSIDQRPVSNIGKLGRMEDYGIFQARK